MDQNPYQAPSVLPPVTGVKSGTREGLKSVAQYQKGIVICILVYIISVFVSLGLPSEIRFLVSACVLLVGLIGTIFVFLLAMKVYSTGVGIALGILTLVPCIGLITLLVVNAKATDVLKQNGIRVGLLGADMSQL